MAFCWEDILKEMERLDSANPDGFTTWEMAKAVGHTQSWCRKKIRLLIEAGKAEYAGTKKIERSDKRVGHMPVYRLLES